MRTNESVLTRLKSHHENNPDIGVSLSAEALADLLTELERTLWEQYADGYRHGQQACGV